MSNNNYKIVGQDGNAINNLDNPLHPGYIIEMEIEARGLKKQDVARQLGIKPQHLSELIKEKRNVSALLALKLEQVFDVEADYWLRVQSGYELNKARKKLEKSCMHYRLIMKLGSGAKRRRRNFSNSQLTNFSSSANRELVFFQLIKR